MQSEIEATIKHCDPVVAEYAAGYLNHAAHQFSAENDPLADAAAAITQLLISASGDLSGQNEVAVQNLVDKFVTRLSEWGVGEPADLITLNPLFDPEKNAWCLRYDITGYAKSVPPRRTSIITIGRFSRRLLQAMHEEASRNKHTMFPEMFPGSIALHHGLKGVYIPHPVYFDRRWPLDRLDSVFNKAETPENSVYYFPFTPGTGEANFLTASYYYNTEFGPPLWHRWLGRESGGAGGPEAEKESGRMCLRGALIHPVKQDLAADKAIGAT